MNYLVELLPAALQQLQKPPAGAQRRILAALAALETNPRPRGAVKLSGEENLWRIRVGDYRIIYEIHDDRLLVLVVRIGHRKDVYRGSGAIWPNWVEMSVVPSAFREVVSSNNVGERIRLPHSGIPQFGYSTRRTTPTTTPTMRASLT